LKSSTSSFKVLRTSYEHRRLGGGVFVAAVNSKIRREHKFGSAVLVVYEKGIANTTRMLALICKLIIDDELQDSEVRLDQTIRNAIGIPFQYDEQSTIVEIRSIRGVRRFNNWAAQLLRRRSVVLRVHKIDIPDMEKNFGRCELAIFDVLGIEPGGRVVIEGWDRSLSVPTVRRVTINLLALDKGFLEQRLLLEANDLSARFPSGPMLLGVDPDIRGLYLDSHERAILGVDALDPVRVRCDVRDLVAREFTEFGLLFLVTLFSLSQVLPIDVSWPVVAFIAVGSFVLSLVTVVVKLRAR
jgi:hypothetical protein